MNERRMRAAACSGPSRSRFAGRGNGVAFRSALSERPAPPPAEASRMPDVGASVTPAARNGGGDGNGRALAFDPDMLKARPDPCQLLLRQESDPPHPSHCW